MTERPSDRAIAQAFREYTDLDGVTSHWANTERVLQRAREIDAAAPEPITMRNTGDSEQQYIADAEIACPYCAGSGHRDDVAARLRDPATVHALMLRGVIARPTWRVIVDLMGEVPNSEDAQLRRIAELQYQLAAALEGAQTVAEVVQREPFLDGLPNPMKELRWSLRNCEDDLPVGTKLYTAPALGAAHAIPEGWRLTRVEGDGIAVCGPNGGPTVWAHGHSIEARTLWWLADAMLASIPQDAARAPKSQADCPERYKGAYSFRHGWATGYNDAMIDAERRK